MGQWGYGEKKEGIVTVAAHHKNSVNDRQRTQSALKVGPHTSGQLENEIFSQLRYNESVSAAKFS